MNRSRLILITLAAAAVALMGCATAVETEPVDDGGPSSTSAGGGNVGGGGAGGNMGGGGEGGESLCAVDCASIDTPQCLVAVCNEGMYPGPVGECVVVNDADGAMCDDGQFCTVQDSCSAGQCLGGPQNDCGMPAVPCQSVTCNENAAACAYQPADNGAACTPDSLCETNGMCTNGLCIGQPKDCFFAPVDDCELAVCDPADGVCKGQPDPTQDGQPCIDQMDLCTDGKTCSTGTCVGGFPKDCSALDIGCQNGVCDTMTGVCMGQAVMVGGQCNDGVGQCETGICDANQNCVTSPVVNGTACDDYSTCTNNDVCTAGVCGGTYDPMCTIYFEETFEVCPPPGWVLNPEWECGAPVNVGPTTVQQGAGLLGTDLDSDYENSQTYENMYAQTPPIGLGTANGAVMSYYHWLQTEGSSFDGYNVKVSNDGGQTFNVVTTVDPPYNLTVGGEPAFGGQGLAWEQVQVNLSAYVGQQVIVRFSFRSDGSVTYPGVYIDDIQVGDADTIPIVIDTTSIPNGLENVPYNAQLTHSGGSGLGVWSIQGGTNINWLSINPSTGLLTGTPATANVGPASVTVRHHEPTNPTNFDEVTYNFNVQTVIYVDDIETACPGNWTLGGDWQCGAPTSGPNAAFSGTQVLATQLAGNYNNSQSWAVATASSAPISLVGTTAPQLHFQVWYHTEGFTYDAFNVKVSTDGGMTYNIVPMVTPAYNLTVDSQACWGGDFQMWQEYIADLSAYAGQQVNLQFGFRTDGSVTYPGVYIDDVAITD